MRAGLTIGGRYQLISRLDAGGMGSVWRARDLTLHAEVAIKVLDEQFGRCAELRERFQREAMATAALRSTYVVQILDFGVDGDRPFIAMELMNGEDLAERLGRSGALTPTQAARILSHVACALALAHERGIVHRDLKPENIFLVREGDDEIGKLLDFGIAKSLGGPTALRFQTVPGTVLGTPFYMSPEQVMGDPVDHRTDIWAYGIIAFECLTGERTFDRASVVEVFQAITAEHLPVPSHRGEVPAGFDEWFAKTAARDQSARFQTIQAAARGLKQRCSPRAASCRWCQAGSSWVSWGFLCCLASDFTSRCGAVPKRMPCRPRQQHRNRQASQMLQRFELRMLNRPELQAFRAWLPMLSRPLAPPRRLCPRGVSPLVRKSPSRVRRPRGLGSRARLAEWFPSMGNPTNRELHRVPEWFPSMGNPTNRELHRVPGFKGTRAPVRASRALP